MIGKVHHVKSVRSSTTYDEKKMDKEKSEFMFDSFGGRDKEDRIKHLEETAELGANPKMENRFSHISLSLAPGTMLDSMEKKVLICMYLGKMGYGGAPFMVYEHKDRDHPHFHIIVSRVKNSGEVVDSKHNYYKNKTVCEELRREFNLKEVPSTRSEKRKSNRIVHAEKHGYELHITNMWKKLDDAKIGAESLDEYLSNASQNGVFTRLYPNRENPIGISYSIRVRGEDGLYFKFVARGRALGEGYMLKNLTKEKLAEYKPVKKETPRIILKDQSVFDDFISRVVDISTDHNSLTLNLSRHGLKIDDVNETTMKATFTYNDQIMDFTSSNKVLLHWYLWDLRQREMEEERKREKEMREEMASKITKPIKRKSYTYETFDVEFPDPKNERKINR
jgi:hypothetical protein